MAPERAWVPPHPGWTCPACGFAYDAAEPASTPDAFRGFGRRYRTPLSRGLAGEDLDALLRVRPSAERWSALEYAGHVRDVFAVHDDRIARALAEDRPPVARMDPDELVVERAYNAQDPAALADELAEVADRLAARLAAVDGGGWQRVVVRDGNDLTVDWMARNAAHEGGHHLLDVGRTLREARGR